MIVNGETGTGTGMVGVAITDENEGVWFEKYLLLPGGRDFCRH